MNLITLGITIVLVMMFQITQSLLLFHFSIADETSRLLGVGSWQGGLAWLIGFLLDYVPAWFIARLFVNWANIHPRADEMVICKRWIDRGIKLWAVYLGLAFVAMMMGAIPYGSSRVIQALGFMVTVAKALIVWGLAYGLFRELPPPTQRSR